jgi:hypothetical protein
VLAAGGEHAGSLQGLHVPVCKAIKALVTAAPWPRPIVTGWHSHAVAARLLAHFHQRLTGRALTTLWCRACRRRALAEAARLSRAHPPHRTADRLDR